MTLEQDLTARGWKPEDVRIVASIQAEAVAFIKTIDEEKAASAKAEEFPEPR